MKESSEVLGIKIVGGLREKSTPWGGASLLIELFRRAGMDGVANKVLPAKGVSQGTKAGADGRGFRAAQRAGRRLCGGHAASQG